MAELPKDAKIERSAFFSSLRGRVVEGIALFNKGKYFEAHEAWEDLWLKERDASGKRFYQGLIMAAGAMLHYTKRECAGANSLLEKSIPMIQEGMHSHPNLRIGDLTRPLDGLKDEFSRCSYSVPAESLPKISRMYIYC